MSVTLHISAILMIILYIYSCSSQDLLMRKSNYVTMTSMRCFALDPSYVRFDMCRLKPINRTLKIASVHLVLLKSFDKNVMIRFRVLKKANGGWKPFVIDSYFDGCKYMAGRKNPAYDWIFNIAAARYTNINHSCPYDSDVFWNYPVRQVKLPSVFPDGEYRNELQADTLGVPRVAVHGYMTVKEIS